MGADDIVVTEKGVDSVQIVREMTNGKGVDLVVEFAGSTEAGRQSLEMTRRGDVWFSVERPTPVVI